MTPSLKERARLLARDFGAKWAGLGDDAIKDLTALLQSVHDEAIEKAAEVADGKNPAGAFSTAIAEAIRCLKSTPSITERG